MQDKIHVGVAADKALSQVCMSHACEGFTTYWPNAACCGSPKLPRLTSFYFHSSVAFQLWLYLWMHLSYLSNQSYSFDV